VLPRLLERWLPGGRIEGAEYVARNPKRHDQRPGSFKVNLATGRWADFATGDKGGDPISLAAYLSKGYGCRLHACARFATAAPLPRVRCARQGGSFDQMGREKAVDMEKMNIGEMLNSSLPIEVRDRAAALFSHLGNYFKDKIINEHILAPMILMARIIRTHDAIGSLCDEMFYTEAATLLLTQFDLRLDLWFVCYKPENATLWMGHDDKKWPVSSTKGKIDTLVKPGEEHDRLAEIYTYLSGIKHANPVYGMLGFPVEVDGGNLVLSTGNVGSGFTVEFGDIVRAYSLYQLASSAQVMNVYPIRYTVIKKEPREEVRRLARKLYPVEEKFREFMQGIVSAPRGPFGFQRQKKKAD
jgi:hypothetical protein